MVTTAVVWESPAAVQAGRQLRQAGDCLLWWDFLTVLVETGTGCRSRRNFTSCTSPILTPCFPGRSYLLQGYFRRGGTCHSCSFCFIQAANSGFLLNLLSQPHVLALSHCQNWHLCLRQDSQEGFGMDSVQDPRDYIGGRGLALRNR